jgi:hypothetical protein
LKSFCQLDGSSLNLYGENLLNRLAWFLSLAPPGFPHQPGAETYKSELLIWLGREGARKRIQRAHSLSPQSHAQKEPDANQRESQSVWSSEKIYRRDGAREDGALDGCWGGNSVHFRRRDQGSTVAPAHPGIRLRRRIGLLSSHRRGDREQSVYRLASGAIDDPFTRAATLLLDGAKDVERAKSVCRSLFRLKLWLPEESAAYRDSRTDAERLDIVIRRMEIWRTELSVPRKDRQSRPRRNK